MFCFSVLGQDWRDEDMVWDEDKGEWVVQNKVVVPAPHNENAGNHDMVPQYTEEWARYLPRTVRYGKRAATNWEISEAKRKLWAKEMITVRAMQRSEQRRQIVAHRKATGWHSKRSSNAFAPNPVMRYHMNTSGFRY